MSLVSLPLLKNILFLLRKSKQTSFLYLICVTYGHIHMNLEKGKKTLRDVFYEGYVSNTCVIMTYVSFCGNKKTQLREI